VNVADAAGALDEDIAFALYHLAHEALTNALRHSGARHIHLCLQLEGRGVALEVHDDGSGLPRGWDRSYVDHRGLTDAATLVRAVRGASVAIETNALDGTTVRANIPCRPCLTGRDT
jgi:signal transduction histidine kinase